MSAEDNLNAVQDDIYYGLLSWSPLANVNIVSERRQTLAGTLDISTLANTARNSKVGMGVLVAMPELGDSEANTEGPADTWRLTVVVVEQGMNNTTGVTAESVGLLIRQFIHGFLLEDKGALYLNTTSMVPEPAFNRIGPAYRVEARLRLHETPKSRTAQPTIAEAAGEITLTGSGSIYYTTDGSFPGSGNSAATLYSAPFTVDAGTVVRWAAYDGTNLPSHVGHATVT